MATYTQNKSTIEEKLKHFPWIYDSLLALDMSSLKEGNLPLH